MGRGGAGALVYLGLATNYAFNSDRQAGETINAYYHRLATGMRGIKPGAALQFWDTEAQFILCKAGNHPCPPVGNFCGHSPLCAAVNLPAENVELIDQFGRSAFPFSGTPTDRRLKWDGHDANVWFAADWNE